jgi:putative transcriptional regulator
MHPPEETLLAFASGQADLPHRVMVEEHLDRCAPCCGALHEITAAGGALLAGLSPVPPPEGLWEELRRRIENAAPGRPATALPGMPLSTGARRELPADVEVRWRRTLARGARYAVLARDPFTGGVLLVGHMPPGRFFPRHRHAGREDTLVLAGGYADEWGRHDAGQYAVYPPGSQHRPLTDAGEECWVLARLERPNRLLGWRGWLERLLEGRSGARSA